MTTRNFTKVFKEFRSNKQEVYLDLDKNTTITINEAKKKLIEDQIKYYDDEFKILHNKILEYNKISIGFASKENPEKKYHSINNHINELRNKINNFDLPEINKSLINNIKVALINKLNNIVIILRKTIKENNKRTDKLIPFSEIEFDDNDNDNDNDNDYDNYNYTDNDMLIEMKSIDYNHEEIIKREQNIKKINDKVQELNSMFLEVHNLINDQGFILDRIEDNIYQASNNITIANKNIQDVHKSQQTSSNLCCYILLIFSLIFGFLLILSIIVYNVNSNTK